MKIKLMPEYLCEPLWIYDEQSGIPRNVTPEELGLPFYLVQAIRDHDRDFQATFDAVEPWCSGFRCEYRLVEHWRRGVILAQEIANAIPGDLTVEYERTGEVSEDSMPLTRRRSLRAA
jgi:hypothetical protein